MDTKKHKTMAELINESMQFVFKTHAGTGRTKRMVDDLLDGDCVIFATEKERQRVTELTFIKGVKVKTKTVSPQDLDRLTEIELIEGRLIFDHNWLEEYYIHQFSQAQDKLKYFQLTRQVKTVRG